MSEPENFIARWSRRKRNAAEEAKPATSTNVGEEPRAGSDPAPVLSGASESSEAAFDLTKLPPIETITADTDIRATPQDGRPLRSRRRCCCQGMPSQSLTSLGGQPDERLRLYAVV